MKCEIVIVSYLPDLEWITLSLRSISKYATGFSGVTIIVPWQDLGSFLPFEAWRTKDGAPIRVKKYIDVPGKGMLMHEVMICSADIYCPHAEFIMHMDSDCLFHEAVTPEDYIRNGKPDLLMVKYTSFPAGRAEYKWQQNVMRALGYSIDHVPFETMQRHPSVHVKDVYSQMRHRVEEIHKCPFNQYVIEQENSWPQGFAEFPTIGAYAYWKLPSAYNFIEIEKPDIQGHPKSAHKVTQFWSHASRDPKHWELYQNQLRMARRIVA